MTSIFKTLLVLSLAFAGTAAAQDRTTWYAGIGIGQTTLETTGDTTLPTEPPQNAKIDEDDDLTRVNLGFRPSDFFAIEAGLFSGGDFSTILAETSPGSGDGIEVAADTSGYDVSILGILPLANRSFDLFVRLGVQRGEFRFNARDQADPGFDDNFNDVIKQTNRLIGIGGQFNFGDRKQYGLRLEANQVEGKDRIDAVTDVLLSFNFGWGGS